MTPPGTPRRGLTSHLQSMLQMALVAASFLSIGLTTGLSPWLWAPVGAALAVVPRVIHMRHGEGLARYAQHVAVLATLTAITLAFLYSVWGMEGQSSVAVPANLVTLVLAVALSFNYRLLREASAASQRERSLAAIRCALGGPSLVLSFCIASVVCSFMLLVLSPGKDDWPLIAYLYEKILDRGIIPPICLLLLTWGLMILVGKTLNLWREDKALNAFLAETEAKRSLSGSALVEDGVSRFGAWRRVAERSERVEKEVDEYSEATWQVAEESFLVIHYIAWAIPILGFIGTVFGISLSVSELGHLMVSREDVSEISSALGEAIAPLGLAFDTTLVALSLSVTLVFAQTMLQRWESSFLKKFEFLILSKVSPEGERERPDRSAPPNPD